jgi:hypothetical protein
MTFRAEEDRWSIHGRNILAPEKRAAIRECLERSPIIVEHWYYRAGRSPDRLIFDDIEDFDDYLQSRARPGDAFHIWEFATLCRDDNTVANGKYPDPDGYVPEQGAY